MGHPGDVLQGELEGEVERAEVGENGGTVAGADVLLPTEGGDSDGVGPERARLHVCEAPVDVSHATVSWGNKATIDRDETTAVQGLDQLLL